MSKKMQYIKVKTIKGFRKIFKCDLMVEKEGIQQSDLDERIIMELSKHIEPIAYSELRDKFDYPDFVERLSYLIMTDKVTIFSWGEEGESKYPDEVRKINEIYQKYESDYGGIAVEDVRQFAFDLLMNRASSVPSSSVDKKEPYLFYRPTSQNL